jgi:hypothetical protein
MMRVDVTSQVPDKKASRRSVSPCLTTYRRKHGSNICDINQWCSRMLCCIMLSLLINEEPLRYCRSFFTVIFAARNKFIVVCNQSK